MKKWITAFLFIIFGTLAVDAAETKYEFYPLNHQTRLESGQGGEMKARNALQFAMGGSRGAWGLLLEYGRFDQVSGTEYASIQQAREETLLWVRHESRAFDSLFLTGGAGLGFSRSTVDTRFGGDAVIDQGRAETLAALSAGSGIEIKKTLRLSLEGRLFFGSQFAEGPQPDLVFRSGFRF